ncbi:tripartite tricarboxylate transporter substrate binding protein [bacterium BD-1]|nr:tripartite tricarboxylate transporter substrate binding protein [Ottowia caeni]
MTISSLRRSTLRAALLGLLAGTSLLAHAAYPEQPIKLVVGFPPGGGGDLYGRAIATELAKHIGQAVVVENRTGAGGNIAAEQVAQAKPDGHTLLLAMSGNLGSAPAIRQDLRYKVPDDFVLIHGLVETPFGLMVSESSRIKSYADFVAAAKSGKLSYASTGTGGSSQIVMEMIKQQAGLEVLHVPYRGSGPVLNDLHGGVVDSFFAPYTPLMGQIRGGKLRLLAVSSATRAPNLPDVPTLKEQGVNVAMTQWYGLAAPKGTPAEVIEHITRAVKQSLKSADLLKVYRADGAQESELGGVSFRDFVVRDISNYKAAAVRGDLKTQSEP